MRVTYETLKREWEQALERCGFFCYHPTQELLDWNRMSRHVENGVMVWPLGTTVGDGLFEMGAKLGWDWSALQTERYITTEDDTLIQMIGPDNLDRLSLPTTAEDAQSELRVSMEIWVHIRRDRTVYPTQFDLVRLANGIADCVRRFFENVKDHRPESPADPYFYICWTSDPSVSLRWTANGFAIDTVVVEVRERCLLPRAWDYVEEFYPIDPIDEQFDGILSRVREAMLSVAAFLDNFQDN
jgi:hypothetical protein